MTQPEEHFQPRSVSDVLVDAFNLFVRDWTQYMLVAALLVIPLTLVDILLNRALADSDGDAVTVTGGVVVGLIGLIVTVVIQLVVTGALARAGASGVAGLEVDVIDGAAYALGKLGPLLWVIILSTLAILGGLILLIIPGLIIAVMLFVSVDSFIVEGHRGSTALGRSWGLVKTHFWHVVGVVLLSAILTGLMQAILDALGGDSFAGQWLVTAIGLLLVVPYTALVGVVTYVELRARNEGLTVAQLRDELVRTAR
jgi:hypothetical protein